MRRFFLLAGTLAIAFSSAIHGASLPEGESKEADLQLRQQLEARIAALPKEPSALEKIRQEGRDRTILCKTCHGVGGVSVKPNTPHLAGQNPAYIVDQFQRFGDGRRNDFFMSSLAKSFSDEDKIKIALYYSGLPPRSSGNGRPELQRQGAAIYASACVSCHGKDAAGLEGYARLAGQQPDYVVKMLKEFKERTGRRSNPWMSAVAVRLSEDEMVAVAAYLANLN